MDRADPSFRLKDLLQWGRSEGGFHQRGLPSQQYVRCLLTSAPGKHAIYHYSAVVDDHMSHVIIGHVRSRLKTERAIPTIPIWSPRIALYVSLPREATFPERTKFPERSLGPLGSFTINFVAHCMRTRRTISAALS